ncbi:hypothetical protein ANTQUA_LOCUS9484 [Anthophora quadrimaculata]
MARQFEFYLNTREFPRALSATHLAHRPRNRNSCLFEGTWIISLVNRRSRTVWILVSLLVECEVTRSQVFSLQTKHNPMHLLNNEGVCGSHYQVIMDVPLKSPTIKH